MLYLQYTRHLLLRHAVPQRICASKIHANDNKPFEPKLSLKLVHLLPKPTQPYLRLIRLDRPTGFWLIYLPSTWGIASAALPGHLPSLGLLSLFALGTLVMRGTACTINDLWDRDIDAKVSRTADRPLVNGEITVNKALWFLFVELCLGLSVLLQLNLASVILGISCMGLVLTYPTAKRVMKWPQILLGFSVNWGVLLGFAASANCLILNAVVPVYAAAIFWTLFYDTIYAHLDREDDLKLGVNSTAISLGQDTHKWLLIFSSGMIGSLILGGIVSEQTLVYYTIVGVVGSQLGKQVWTLNLNDKEDCFNKFEKTFDIGVLVFLAIALGNLFKRKRETKIEREKEAISRFEEIH